MLMCLDVGNTHIFGGVYKEDKLILRFRYATGLIGTADQFGIFLINILLTNQIAANEINAFSVSSVVPSTDYTIKHMASLYFKSEFFSLKAGVKTGLNIKYKNPNEVGADRIANAIAAVNHYPRSNLIIVDMGTATTFCTVSSKQDYLGGAILPGMRLGMEALKINTAKLMEVDIEVPPSYVGRSTRESIQAGLYYGHLGALREILAGTKKETFHNEAIKVIGTGGFSQLFKDKGIFDVILPDLVLQGLYKAYEYSRTS